MCVYARTLPWRSVLRVWDMFLCEGKEGVCCNGRREMRGDDEGKGRGMEGV